MDSHMHHLRQSSTTLHSPYAATKKVMEEEETDTEEEEEEEEAEVEEVEEEDGSGVFGGEVEEEPEFKKKRTIFVEGSRKRGSRTTAAAAEGAGGGGAGGVTVAPPPPSCRAEKCNADLTDSKSYHKRHKVCEYHAKAEVVMVEGLKQRFCQQCSRFHELSEFDEAKRSCRRRLAGHNERRRKQFSESRREGSGQRGSNPGIKKDQCRQVDHERGTVLSENNQNLHIH